MCIVHSLFCFSGFAQTLLWVMQMQLISAGSVAHAHRQEQQANARKESA